MERDLMRYTLKLEMLERNRSLSDDQAIALLHGEFALALNAARFDVLTASDVAVEVVSRSTPQEGVTRYVVELELEERASEQDDEQALALLRRAFQNALNASFFLRVCVDDAVSIELISRTPVAARAAVASGA